MASRYAPRGLENAGKRLWKDLHEEGFEFNAAEYRILEDACREADLIETLEDRLQEEIKAGRMIVKGSQGQPTANPLVAEIRQHRMSIKALIGALKIPEEGADEASNAGAALVNHRWKRSG